MMKIYENDEKHIWGSKVDFIDIDKPHPHEIKEWMRKIN